MFVGRRAGVVTRDKDSKIRIRVGYADAGRHRQESCRPRLRVTVLV